MKGYFITATGTDIGKTYVSACLINHYSKQGLHVGYYKPFMSGPSVTDLEYIHQHTTLEKESALVSYAFSTAVSPHLAAQIENREIHIDKIIDDFNSFKRKHDLLIIEGCGGLICPLSPPLMQTDLIKAFHLPLILVTNAALGTINSTLLTMEYAHSKNLSIQKIIMNQYDEKNFLHRDNKKMITNLTSQNILTLAKNHSSIKIS